MVQTNAVDFWNLNDARERNKHTRSPHPPDDLGPNHTLTHRRREGGMSQLYRERRRRIFFFAQEIPEEGGRSQMPVCVDVRHLRTSRGIAPRDLTQGELLIYRTPHSLSHIFIIPTKWALSIHRSPSRSRVLDFTQWRSNQQKDGSPEIYYVVHGKAYNILYLPRLRPKERCNPIQYSVVCVRTRDPPFSQHTHTHYKFNMLLFVRLRRCSLVHGDSG